MSALWFWDVDCVLMEEVLWFVNIDKMEELGSGRDFWEWFDVFNP